MDSSSPRGDSSQAPSTYPATASVASSALYLRRHGSANLNVTGLPQRDRPSLAPHVEKSQYLSKPPPGIELIKLCFAITSPHYNTLDAQDPDQMQNLDQVCIATRVWIDRPEGTDVEWLIIRAESKRRLFEAVTAIEKMLKAADEDESGQFAYLIEPPHHLADFKVLLRDFAEKQWRPVAAPPTPLLIDFGQDVEPVRPTTLEALLASSYPERFRQQFEGFVPMMCQEGNPMRVRIHFGAFILKERPRRVDSWAYSDYDRLLKLVSRRGNGCFNQDIGDAQTANSVLRRVYSSKHMFIPQSATTLRLEDVKPTYTFVIQAQDWRLDIETQVQGVKIRPSYCRVYRIGRRQKQAELIASCPERKLDWQLEVLNEANTTTIPQAILEFRDRLKFQPIVKADQFPVPIYNRDLARKARVDVLVGKAIWTFAMPESEYLLQVAVHRQWDPQGMAQDPRQSCGISLHGGSWGEVFRVANTSTNDRVFGDNHEAVFPPSDKKDGFSAFLDMMTNLQDMLQDGIPEAGQSVKGRNHPQATAAF